MSVIARHEIISLRLKLETVTVRLFLRAFILRSGLEVTPERLHISCAPSACNRRQSGRRSTRQSWNGNTAGKEEDQCRQ